MMTLAIRSPLKSIKPLRSVIRPIRQRIHRLREDTWLLEGKERTSGQPLSILFKGERITRNYISEVFFKESWTEKEHARTWKYRRLQRALDVNGRHDLAIVQLDGPQPVTDSGAALYKVPCWVGGERDLHACSELARRSEHIKSDIRRIRKNRLSYRVTSEPEEFDRFYHSMYLPYIQRVFGNHAFLMSYQAMQSAIPDSELFLVTQDDKDIAGGILVYDGSDRVRGWSLGVKDGDDRWVRAGALAAFDHLQTDYLLEKGFRRLHRGGSRPFLNDGSLRFKKNRGMVITSHTPRGFIILPLRDTPAVRALLQHNPFIYEDEGKLKGAIFVPGEVIEEDAARMYHDWYVPGLEGLTLFSLDQGHENELTIRICGWVDQSGALKQAYSKE
jgi:hypothetical protein